MDKLPENTARLPIATVPYATYAALTQGVVYVTTDETGETMQQFRATIVDVDGVMCVKYIPVNDK